MPAYNYRGLEQLPPATPPEQRHVNGLRVALVPVNQIRVHPHNVRQNLGDLRGMTGSISRHGIMQPVVVERRGDHLRLRAGHRRLAAARLANLSKIPAVIHPRSLDDAEWLIASLQENEERVDLNDEERTRAAEALQRLGCSIDDIAEAFGTSRARILRWLHPDKTSAAAQQRTLRLRAANRARSDLVQLHRREYEELMARHTADLDPDGGRRQQPPPTNPTTS